MVIPNPGLKSIKKFLVDMPILGGPDFYLHTHMQDRLLKSRPALAEARPKTRRHSNRMLTACSLPYGGGLSGGPLSGGLCPGGLCQADPLPL